MINFVTEIKKKNYDRYTQHSIAHYSTTHGSRRECQGVCLNATLQLKAFLTPQCERLFNYITIA